MFVDEGRNVVAHVEDEPDGEKAGDAVKIDLQKIANDVAVQESQWNCGFRISDCGLQ